MKQKLKELVLGAKCLVLDAREDAVVYLGVRNGVDRDAMIEDLRAAQRGEIVFDAEKYVNRIPASLSNEPIRSRKWRDDSMLMSKPLVAALMPVFPMLVAASRDSVSRLSSSESLRMDRLSR